MLMCKYIFLAAIFLHILEGQCLIHNDDVMFHSKLPQLLKLLRMIVLRIW